MSYILGNVKRPMKPEKETNRGWPCNQVETTNVQFKVIAFHLTIRTCFPCLHSLVKTEANVWENSRADQWKPETQSRVSPAWEFSQTLPRFSAGYGGTDKMFYFFYKIIIFVVKKEKDDIRSAYCKFSLLGDSQTILLTPFSCFIALWKHTCWPIKTHVQSKLFYKTIWLPK